MSKRHSKTAQSTLALERLLPMPAVMDLTSLSKATVYRKIGDGSFPPPLKIGKSRVAWRQSDVAKWIDAQSCTS
jgi:prophage regulatory protein